MRSAEGPMRSGSVGPDWPRSPERPEPGAGAARARSATPLRQREDRSGGQRSATLPTRRKANVKGDVNPFVEFPSLRRGFTLNGQPIPGAHDSEQVAILKADDDSSSAYMFWAIFIFLSILALANLILTAVIFKVLRIGSNGMEGIEFLPNHNAIKFVGHTDMGNIIKEDGVISGYSGENLQLVGLEGGVVLSAGGSGHASPALKVTGDTISLTGVHDLTLVDPVTGKVVFSTSDPQLELPDGVRVLEVDQAEVERVVSPLDQPLLVRSDSELRMRGAEGVEIEGARLSLTSNEDISFVSENGSVVLDGGIVLDTVMLPHGGGGYQGERGEYKLCVCMPTGTVFRVAIPDDNPVRPPLYRIGCHSVDLSKHNPCA